MALLKLFIMKKYLLIINTLCSCMFMQQCVAASPQVSLSGRITELVSGNPVPGITIYVTDLKTGAVTDIDGNYMIHNLPQSRIKVQVSGIGYKMISTIVDLNTTQILNFTLEESVAELNEIVVSGLSLESEKNRTPVPVTTIPALQLQQISASNIIDAIATQPGINQVSTGAAISKPVIRGLGFNRVVVVNDGIRQEGQQWGDEHGIEIDEYSVDHVEILKGPASLVYGSDAMAGVIKFMSAPTLPDKTISGKLISNFQSNNGLIGNSINVAGRNKGFIWDVRFSNKLAHDYKNKTDGYVLNSGFSEQSFSGLAGINRSWGFSHVHFSRYYISPGIVEGDRDSITGKFIKSVAINDTTPGFVIADNTDFKKYSNQFPKQKIAHYKVVLNNNFIVRNSSLKVILGWQQNQRREFTDILNRDEYGLYFLLNTFNYGAQYVLPEQKGWIASIGVNGMLQNSQNRGQEFLVPEYELFDAGVFGIFRKTFKNVDISGGVRFDNRSQNVKSLFVDEDGKATAAESPGASQKFSRFTRDFHGISGSLGASFRLSEIFYTKVNVSRGYRAPNIAELGSNGEHEGTSRYEIGNPDLNPEHSLQFDFTFGINTEHVTGELNLFHNTIDNFIFISKISNSSGNDSITDGIPVYTFVSSNSQLTGGEVSIDIHPHPLDWLHIENTFSYVNGERLNEPDSAKYLPFIPAPKLTSELKATSKKLFGRLENGFMKLGYEHYFRQDNIYSVNETESPTNNYSLYNFSVGTDFKLTKTFKCIVQLSVLNILDESYQNHLSRLKYTPENYATGQRGIMGMGRNYSIKLILPITHKHKARK